MLVFTLLIFILLIGCLILFPRNNSSEESFVEVSYSMESPKTEIKLENKKKFVIVVPYGNLKPEQNRSEQLELLLKRIKTYDLQDIHVVIAEQKIPIDKFNKGKLFNAIVDFFIKTEIFRSIEYVIFNDVDMIPNKFLFEQYFKTLLPCSYVPKESKTHMKNYSVDKYPYAGGIFGIRLKDYIRANGFPNDFWGWGAEDEIFSARVSEKLDMPFIKVELGEYESTDNFRNVNGFKSKINHLSENSLINDKLQYRKRKDGSIFGLEVKESARLDTDWMVNGLNTLNYEVIDQEEKDGILFVRFNLT